MRPHPPSSRLRSVRDLSSIWPPLVSQDSIHPDGRPQWFGKSEQPALIVGQDGILRATQRVPGQPAPANPLTGGSGGLPTHRRLPTGPTSKLLLAAVGPPQTIGRAADRRGSSESRR